MQIIQRLDFEIAALGLSVGTTAGLLASRAGAPDALLTGAVWAAGTVASVYAIRIIGQALPLPSMGELGGAVGAFTSALPALPALLPTVALTRGPVEPVAPSDADLWKMQLYSFLVAADLNGDSFSMRTMIARGFVTDTAYRRLSAPLKSAGVLEPSKAGTDYAPGWNKRLARLAIFHDRVPLPDGRPPRVTL